MTKRCKCESISRWQGLPLRFHGLIDDLRAAKKSGQSTGDKTCPGHERVGLATSETIYRCIDPATNGKFYKLPFERATKEKLDRVYPVVEKGEGLLERRQMKSESSRSHEIG